ncbi:septal ring lytic transglycosylase RlpA family protein [Luteimonas sp. 22616]|uniref:septal ring lytic transglycosylase RlpA family protein n=1 Tax=Luteimonas sp. 22616 TaxID=3453951 RepID=UPI003F858844
MLRPNAPLRILPALAVIATLALAGCASGPKKSASEASALPDGEAVRRGELPSGKRSPYAPAQEDTSKRGHYTAGGLYAPHIQDSVPDDLPDVDAIPEPDVVAEPRSRYGNRSPYKVLGKSYKVRDSAEGYDEKGMASYYGNKFHGRRTSNLEVYDMYAFTAAHKTLPLPSFARVTNLDNGKSVVVRVNDRGPFHDGRIIDLSYAAAVKIGIRAAGTGRVEVVGLSPGENARNDYDAVAARGKSTTAPVASGAGNGALQLPPGVRIATGKPQPASAMDKLIEGVLPIGAANASERVADERVTTAPAPATAAASPSTAATGAAASAPAPAGDLDWRFDMRQDGKAMTADEFDAWMKARRARVATGKAGKPDPYGAAAPGARAVAKAPPRTPAPAQETVAAAREADAAVARPVPPPVAAGTGVTLQVAAFGARSNAERALAMLRGAGVPDARLLDGLSAGKQVWRLRVGPVDSAKIPELSARVAGLGFGQPQVVRE